MGMHEMGHTFKRKKRYATNNGENGWSVQAKLKAIHGAFTFTNPGTFLIRA